MVNMYHHAKCHHTDTNSAPSPRRRHTKRFTFHCRCVAHHAAVADRFRKMVSSKPPARRQLILPTKKNRNCTTRCKQSQPPHRRDQPTEQDDNPADYGKRRP